MFLKSSLQPGTGMEEQRGNMSRYSAEATMTTHEFLSDLIGVSAIGLTMTVVLWLPAIL